MFEFSVLPRLSETDGVGHINNTVPPVWFEEARRDLFGLFNPGLKLETWNVILRKYEVEFFNQISVLKTVNIKTHVESIGQTSVTVYQEAMQDDQLVVTARTVLVHFNFKRGKPVEIPDSIRTKLTEHLYNG